MKKILMLLIVLCLGWNQGNAQTAKDPWAIGAGVNKVDFHGTLEGEGDAFKTMELQGVLGEFSLDRYICSWANANATLGAVAFEKEKYDLPGVGVITSDELIFTDFNLQIKFLDWAWNKDPWISPYFYGGVGGQYFNQAIQAKADWGFGFDLWAFKNTGFYFRGDYSYPLDEEIVNYLHLHAGLKYKFSCNKDADKDGILDKEDRCPEIYGLASLQGCPDKDGDGIADMDDKCPDIRGVAALQGCPDADGDGITDAEDRCPNAAGTTAFKGCPDRDGDGIVDIDDDCPDVKGTDLFKGCPDTDGDGIIDKLDACPTVKGIATFQGCPDTDMDGVPDKDDKCPAVAGTVSNKGCPEVTKEDQEQIMKIAKVIQFDTGKDKIKPESLKKLEELVTILNKYPDLQLTVEGHTDDVGKDESNLKLSQDRVNSVKAYLISKGISDSRISAKGFGETMPVVPNTSAANRAQNRRVELKAEY